MAKLRLQDLDVKGKRVLMRVDFNVPLNKDGSISDDTRLKESLPSIQHILKAGGSVVLMSHLGRPKGQDPKLSLKPCAEALCKLLGRPVQMANDCVGDAVEQITGSLKPGQILLLENLRFHPAEEDPSNDPSFAKQLAALGDVYVNDAFGTAHRSHASTAAIAAYFPGKSAAGLLLQKEIQFLGEIVVNPKRPFYAIIGGSKISTKMGVLKSLISKADGIFIGGGMSFTFYKAKGIKIGNSLHEDDQIPVALEFMEECARKKVSFWLPKDLVIADAFSNDANVQTIEASTGIPDGWQGMDIGGQTLDEWKDALQEAGTVFWNGPPGVFEMSRFSKGTEGIAKTLASLRATTVVGGGDSVSAINKLGLASKFSHVSTGGGASLEYIEFGHLPGIDALTDNQ
ncbi:MAG: phosphoglycerate kinase [Verrucomicrobia bacterium]|nr:phosphoglycerate kinase [Verrucomicrobiota bacterium]